MGAALFCFAVLRINSDRELKLWLNLEQRSPTAGAPSKPFVIGRWRLCNKKSIVRHAKRAAVSAIKKSLSEGDA